MTLLLTTAVGCGLDGSRAERTNWPGWRGPRHDGSVHAAGLPMERPLRLELDWQRPLGAGFSSISAVDGIAVTLVADGGYDHVVALREEDGTEIWRYRIAPTRHQDHPEAYDGPLGTPLIHESTVYGVGPHGELFAVRLEDGEPRWTVSMDETLGARAQQFGYATSPAIIGNTLVVQTGAGDGRTTCGLNPVTGELRWSHGSDTAGYQSPLRTEFAGTPQVVTATDSHVFALDPDSGGERWQLEHIAKVHDGYAQVVFLDPDRFLVNYLLYSACYRLTRGEEGVSVEELWRTQDVRSNLAAPVSIDDQVYGFSREKLTRLDAETGEQLWMDDSADEREGRGLLRLDGLLVVWYSDGAITLLEPQAEGPREIARLETGMADSYTSPSFAGGRIFVRNLEQIAAIRIVAER